MYRIYISTVGNKQHCYYELSSLSEAKYKLGQLNKRANLTYIIERVT